VSVAFCAYVMTASPTAPTLAELFEDAEPAHALSRPQWLNALRACGPIPPDTIPALKAALAGRLRVLEGRDLAPRERGYELERLLMHLQALEGLDPWPSFYATPPEALDTRESVAPKKRGRRSGGEQVDGYFDLDGRHFLFEAKWERQPLAVSTLYEFRGRVDGKLSGTLGLFVSASGFAENSEYTLLSGKELNVLLADLADLDAALDTKNSFREMMQIKMREAARRGMAFWPYKAYLDTRDT